MEFEEKEINLFLHKEAGKQLDVLYEIKKIYLDWFNSDCNQISKHTLNKMYEIGEQLKKIDPEVKIRERIYNNRDIEDFSDEELKEQYRIVKTEMDNRNL